MSGNIWVAILLATLIIFLFMFGWMAVVEIRSIYTLGIRVENSLIAAGWTGFSKLDLIKMSERVSLDDREEREIHLNKSHAIAIVRDYIQINLNLDDGLRPAPQSYIRSQRPVVIEEITVFNPEDLPGVTSNGNLLERTTIHIIVLVPKEIEFYGTAYLRKSVLVDIDSFSKK